MKNSANLISSIIIGVSLMVSAFILNGYRVGGAEVKAVHKPTESIEVSAVPEIMTKSQLAAYLQIDEVAVDAIISEDKSIKINRNISSYDSYYFLPFIQIGSEPRFLKSEVDKWLEYKGVHSFFND